MILMPLFVQLTLKTLCWHSTLLYFKMVAMAANVWLRAEMDSRKMLGGKQSFRSCVLFSGHRNSSEEVICRCVVYVSQKWTRQTFLGFCPEVWCFCGSDLSLFSIYSLKKTTTQNYPIISIINYTQILISAHLSPSNFQTYNIFPCLILVTYSLPCHVGGVSLTCPNLIASYPRTLS